MDAAPPINASVLPMVVDLLLAGPRLAQRAGCFALFHIPEAMDNLAGKIFYSGRIIADATARQTANTTITNTSSHFVQSTAAVLEANLLGSGGQTGDDSASILGFALQGLAKLKNFGGVFSYLTSRWALATFAVALLLNRTQFYASSREHLTLRWHTRLGIYAVPIAVFLVQLLHILQAMKCQTSPDFSSLRYGDPLKYLAIDFGGEGGFLYQLSSALLFWQDDASCCTARDMSLVTLGDDKDSLRGSMSLLFWFFLALCTSQLFETLACALQGRQPVPETGMTIFEHSLAFAECEAMISSALDFGFFGLPKVDNASLSSPTDSSGPLVTRAEVMQRLDIPPEVLLVCVITCFSHLSSATLAITGLRDKVRLVNTSIWACCYMSAFVWSFARIISQPIDGVADLGILRFPTVCIVGFIPHLLIFVGILVCGVIYGVALMFTAISVPEDLASEMTWQDRFTWAYRNLQANVQFSASSSIHIKMSEDFYTTLLKIGFNVLTAASEAVYLNEGSRIHVAQMTWLERSRIDELASRVEKRKAPAVPSELLGDHIARGVEFVDDQNAAIGWSPYARERRSRPTRTGENRPRNGDFDSGLGMSTRRNRMQLTLDFVTGIFWLVVSLQAQVLLSSLNKMGIEQRPTWLLKAAGVAEKRRGSARPVDEIIHKANIEFWVLGEDGRLTLPEDDNIDVEVETRRKLQRAGDYSDEEGLSDTLYRWWSSGGWFGNVDGSGEYQIRELEEDATSMISTATNPSTDDERPDVDNSGRRTPTQDDPYAHDRREATPGSDSGVDVGTLSRLLNPQSSTEREEARLLSYSLQSHRPLTRSQYRRHVDRGRANVLSGLRGSAAHQPTEAEEEDNLENFLLEQRSKTRAKAVRGSTWETGAEGMGAGGPQCVVCQSTPRTILVWPCGCLSMCDDCRVGLAARNYTKCICCRTDIAAYSRLYVP